MSELDLDIRAVSSASYGARNTASDATQASTDDQSALTSQTDNSQSTSAVALSSTTGTTTTSGASPAVATAQPSFRYDSFRFIYRSDYGRVVLVDQNPDTGKPISQIPSQRALQIYAEQERTEGQATTPAATANGSGQVGAGSGRRTAVTPTTAASSGAKSATLALVSAAISAAPAPAVASTPATPSPAFLVPSFSPVNITI
jgi:hypothetical protein